MVLREFVGLLEIINVKWMVWERHLRMFSIECDRKLPMSTSTFNSHSKSQLLVQSGLVDGSNGIWWCNDLDYNVTLHLYQLRHIQFVLVALHFSLVDFQRSTHIPIRIVHHLVFGTRKYNGQHRSFEHLWWSIGFLVAKVRRQKKTRYFCQIFAHHIRKFIWTTVFFFSFPPKRCKLTWKLLGSRRFPSRFHMTGLSGVDDWQLTTIESPGCKNERAGSNLICGAVNSDAECDVDKYWKEKLDILIGYVYGCNICKPLTWG